MDVKNQVLTYLVVKDKQNSTVHRKLPHVVSFSIWPCAVDRMFKSKLFFFFFFSSHLSLNPEGLWATTDDSTTSFLHFSLFSTALWDLAPSRPVHSLKLSSHLFLCLPCLLPPFTFFFFFFSTPIISCGKFGLPWPEFLAVSAPCAVDIKIHPCGKFGLPRPEFLAVSPPVLLMLKSTLVGNLGCPDLNFWQYLPLCCWC